jgi:hypothetical protein
LISRIVSRPWLRAAQAGHHQVGPTRAAEGQRLLQGGGDAQQRHARLPRQELDEEAALEEVWFENERLYWHERRCAEGRAVAAILTPHRGGRITTMLHQKKGNRTILTWWL